MIPAFLADIENRKRKDDEDKRAGTQLDMFDMDIPNIDIGFEIPDDDDDDDAQPTLQSKGGTPQVQQPDPMAEARAQIAIDQARADREAAAAAEAERVAAAERQELLARASTAQQTGYNSALTRGQNELAAMGLEDTYGIMDRYRDELNSIRGTIAEDVTNVAPFYGENVFDDVYNDIETGQRRQMMNAFQGDYADGFAENYFGAQADDDIIADILATRQADARANLQRAFDRGQINQTGFDRALAGLSEQSNSGNATLQNLGSGVLADYRNSLNDFAQGTRDAIGNYTLGSVDPTAGFADRLNSRVTEKQGTLQGSILEALGDTKLFDTSSLLTDAGAYQGVTNTAPVATSGTTLGSSSANQLSPTAKKRTQDTGTF